MGKNLRCVVGSDETKLQVITIKSDFHPSPCHTHLGISIAQSAKQIYTQDLKTVYLNFLVT